METLAFAEELNRLDEKRKRREIDAVSYYKSLSSLLYQIEERIENKQLGEEQVKELIPLLRLLVKDLLKRSTESEIE